METKEPKTQPTGQVAAQHEEGKKVNRKLITGIAVAVVAVVVIALGWYFINQSGANAADEAIGKADIEQNDSVALELYKEAATMGHKSGNRAKLMVAINLYQDGKYQEALEYLEDASIDDEVIAAGAYSLTGDCYVNLEKYDEALNAYSKALNKAEGNSMVAPLILIKRANIFRAQQNYAAEFEAYDAIVNQYPEFLRASQFDVRKYRERARVAAGK